MLKCLSAVTGHYEQILRNQSIEIQKLQCELERLKQMLNNPQARAMSPAALNPRHKRPRVADTPPPRVSDTPPLMSKLPINIPNDGTGSELEKNTPPTFTKAIDGVKDESLRGSQAPTVTEPSAACVAVATERTQPNFRPKNKRPTENRSKQNFVPRDQLTVICSNVPEAEASSLEGRRKQEETAWAELGTLMGTVTKPQALTRLSRKPDSANANKPRLLRITLNSPEEVEQVLLAAHVLKGKTVIRIFPDIPWTERQKLRQLPPAEERAERDKRAIFVHGVPESTATSDVEKYRHDCHEWQYIQTLLETAPLITTDVFRIPSSDPEARRDPRLLKILLLTPDMAHRCLRAWRERRKILPPELRLQAPKSPLTSTKHPITEGVQRDPSRVPTDENQTAINQPEAKNGAPPATVRPAETSPTLRPTQDFSPPRTYAAVTQTHRACGVSCQNYPSAKKQQNGISLP